MDVHRLADPGGLLERAGPLLLADEARNNLALGIVGTLRTQSTRYPEHRLWLVEEDGRAVGGALRTPPYGLVLFPAAAAGALEALAGAIDEELPGVVGAVPEVDEFARLWSGRRGVSHATRFEQRIFALERLIPPRPCTGAPRVAEERDLPLLVEWLRAFAVEALGEADPDEDTLRSTAEHRLAAADGDFVLWEDGGTPVSLAAHGSPTPNGTRVGPVYTPPEARSRGYASAVVAHVSAEQLASGRRFCFLYTNLANPTSNKIYADLGYVPVCDSRQIEFSP